MSDMSSLSHKYTTNATFADQINTWVLAVKKASLGVAQIALPTSDELEAARIGLGQLLAAAILRLNAAASGEEWPDEEDAELVCPEEVLERVQDKHKADVAWFLQDLQDAAGALSKGVVLDARLLKVLDEFSDAADGLASESFRRLWRR